MSNHASGEKPEWWDEHRDGGREDAVTSDEVTRHYLRAPNDDGEMVRYWFDTKDLTWQGKSQILSDALTIGENATELAIDQYYKNALESMIQDTSIEGVSKEQGLTIFLAGMSAELGDQLMEIAPDPGKALSDQEEKNSDEPFAEGQAEGQQEPTSNDEQ